MLTLGLLVIIFINILGVPAQHGHASKFCYSCHDEVDAAACTKVEKCHAEGKCGAEINNHHGIDMFKLGCYEHHDCDNQVALVGKRAHHDPLVCRQCCEGELCNNKLCGMGGSTNVSSTAAPAVVGGTDTGPTGTGTGVPGDCVDHEEDGFTCSLLNKDSFCNDPSTLSYMVAHKKCPKYCGFCDDNGNNIAPAPQVTTTMAALTAVTTTTNPDTGMGGVSVVVGGVTDAPAVATQCVDIEENGFVCANFDVFKFCTDPTSFAYPLAVEKCKAHCGFCSKTGDSTMDIM